MPPSTAWRRREESTPQRTTSPTRPGAESIERLSPEPVPVTPTSTQHTAKRARREVNGSHSSTLQGLGLFDASLSRQDSSEQDHLHLDADGRAHPVLGAKLKSPKQQKEHSSKAPSTLYRGPPKRNHARTTSAMSIDDLANAAIYSTSPQFQQNPTFSFGTSPIFHSTSRPNTSYHNGYTQESYDRPAKRIKSERLYSTEWTRDDRPWSSHEAQTEIRQEDAELLLGLRNDINWKHMASKSAPAPAKVEPVPRVKQEPNSPRRYVHNERDEWSFDPSPAPRAGMDWFRRMVQVDGASPALNHDETIEEESYVPSIQTATGTAESVVEHKPKSEMDPPPPEANNKPRRVMVANSQPVCPTCQQVNSTARGGEATMEWIQCEGTCSRWFHLPCAGFTAQTVKKVAKYICEECRPEHGQTTFTRTSTRARAALDYAALNEGVAMSTEHDSMHHFVPGLKNGTIHYYQDDFARIRPELMTRELWENFDGMKRPFVVPSLWNPRFGIPDPAVEEQPVDFSEDMERLTKVVDNGDDGIAEEVITRVTEMVPNALGFDEVVDLDQDYLDMVMPRNLTVPQVAELYGPDETLEVIDVKTQKTSAKYTLRQWAAYYEERGLKEIKNVISLEVSHSRLGRLIRRPKVVRDIDLEDQVWDKESRDAFKKRPVAFYCLMSTGDSYTDFHIDMGGSSVYYHILKGKKVFFFIPPTDKNLKEYEKWNNNAKQSEIWLGDQCDGNVTRVDLYPGDTAFIPAGWIHSVWTPEDSLVIGGNFLTRYDLEMQLKIRDIEKAMGTSMKFTYPHFQRIMWYAAIKYLDDDPVPDSIVDEFEHDQDHRYLRAWPVWQEQETSPEVEPDEGDYNDHHYSKPEANDWPVLREWLYRTARINADLPVIPAVSKDDARKIKGSVPKNHGDPMQVICLFAIWVAWKRGNELVPSWVHTDPTVEVAKQTAKLKTDKLHIPPERRSSRKVKAESPATERHDTPDTDDTESVTSKLPPRRVACSTCRREKKLCKHSFTSKVEESAQQTLEKPRNYSNVSIDVAKLARAAQNAPVVASVEGLVATPTSALPLAPPEVQPATLVDENILGISSPVLERLSSQPSDSNGTMMNGVTPSPNTAKKGRSKACDDCRKSKRRCVHDEHGRVDPAKAAEPSKPRGSSNAKRPSHLMDDPIEQSKRQKTEELSSNLIDPALMGSPVGGRFMPARPVSDVNAFSLPPQHMVNGLPYLMNASGPPLHQPPLQPQSTPQASTFDAALVDPALESTTDPALLPDADISTTIAAVNHAMSLPYPSPTPEVDKGFSPITAGDAASKRESEATPNVKMEEDVVESHAQAIDDLLNGTSEINTNSQQELHSQQANRRIRTPHQSHQTPTGYRNRSTTQNDDCAIEDDDETIEVANESNAITLTSNNLSTHRNFTKTTPKSAPIRHSTKSPSVKRESASPHAVRGRQSATPKLSLSKADSPEIEDESEMLARQLQAQEHGLRHRTSIRS